MNKKLSLAATFCVLGATATGLASDAGLVDHMHAHYDAVLDIQSAVIAGSLGGVRDSAQWLVEHEAPARVPEDWQVHEDAMRAAAQAALDAQDVASAATATARLGAACGGCHVANNITVEFEDPGMPSDKEKNKPHMLRHQWAADRMWEGLIGPNDYAWSRGGNMLFESPMRSVKHADENEAWKGMARRIHQLAANATTVYDMDKKVEIYAEFLANCAACHLTLEQGPGR